MASIFKDAGEQEIKVYYDGELEYSHLVQFD